MIPGDDAALGWEVEFHDDFDPEFDALSQDVQDELLASAQAVQRLGPAADRPHVGSLDNPRHPNMKELRFTANNGSEVWRAAFAFDPQRKAIVLVAADKQGKDQRKFYKNLLRIANQRFDDHLAKLAHATAESEAIQPIKGKASSSSRRKKQR